MILGLDAWIFWLVLTAVLVVIELATVNLVTIWFAGGSLAAMVCALCNASVILQAIVAVGISGVLLAVILIFKPLDKFKHKQNQPTNYDRVIGEVGIVETELNEVLGTGVVRVMGQTWSAVAQDKGVIPTGEQVIVKEVAGVKLVVERAGKDREL